MPGPGTSGLLEAGLPSSFICIRSRPPVLASPPQPCLGPSGLDSHSSIKEVGNRWSR